MRIIEKTNQIIQQIRSSEEMQRYQHAIQKLNRHGDAQALLFVVRARRNAYSQTSLRLGYEHPDSIKAKQELDETLTKIAEIPLIEQYQQEQEDVNEILQGVTRILINTLAIDIPVEIFDDEVQGGCGSASGGCGNGNCGKH